MTVWVKKHHINTLVPRSKINKRLNPTQTSIDLFLTSWISAAHYLITNRRKLVMDGSMSVGLTFSEHKWGERGSRKWGNHCSNTKHPIFPLHPERDKELPVRSLLAATSHAAQGGSPAGRAMQLASLPASELQRLWWVTTGGKVATKLTPQIM